MNLSSGTLFRLLRSGGPVLGLLLVCGLFSLTEERAFIFTGGNLKNILIQTVVVAIGALGMTLIIIGGGIDLSVGSVVAFTGVLAAKLLVAGWAPWTTTLALVVVGGSIGLLNGAIIAGFRMMPFIVTLGMMGDRPRCRQMAGQQPNRQRSARFPGWPADGAGKSDRVLAPSSGCLDCPGTRSPDGGRAPEDGLWTLRVCDWRQ